MQETGFKTAERQRRSWIIQRVAWVLLGGILAFALAGGLGQGALSRARAATPDGGLEARYHRIWRVNDPQDVELLLKATRPGPVSLLLDADFLSRISLQRISPDPTQTVTGPEGQRLFFAASGTGPALIRLRVIPLRAGRVRAQLSADAGPPLRLGFLVLP